MKKNSPLSNSDQQTPIKSERAYRHRFLAPSSFTKCSYMWMQDKPNWRKESRFLNSAVLLFMSLLFISCSGSTVRGTNIVTFTNTTQMSTLTTPSTQSSSQAVTVTKQSASPTTQVILGQPVNTPTSTLTGNNAYFPGLPDTTNNIHVGLLFDFNTNPTSMTGRIDVVWGTSWAMLLPANTYGFFYLPYDRDEDTHYYSAAHAISWYKANHPDWIEYRCDRSTVAYEFGDTNSVPLDITNPAVISYIEGTYIKAALRSGSGYQGIGFDNLDFENAGGWTGQRCGHYSTSGTWVQQFTGTANDAVYRQSVLTWAEQIHSFIHTHFPKAAMAVNFSYDPKFSSDSNKLSSYIDFYVDEQGFTNGNNASPADPSSWYFTDASWSGKMHWIRNALSLGRGFLSINQEPVPFNKVSTNQAQWALANYLLIKNNASFVYICGFQQYGYEFLRPEYSAQIGSPVDAMYQKDGIYLRDFTNGIAIVNPSSTSSYTLQLPRATYSDLYGNAAGPQITMQPHSGLILIHS